MLELAPKLVDMRETKHGGKSRLHFDVHLKWGTPNISIFTYVYRQLFSIGPSNWVNCCCFCFLSASFGEHWGCTWRTILKEDLLSSEAAAILGFGQSLMRTDFWSGSFVNDSKKIHITICLSSLKKIMSVSWFLNISHEIDPSIPIWVCIDGLAHCINVLGGSSHLVSLFPRKAPFPSPWPPSRSLPCSAWPCALSENSPSF